MRCNFSCCAKLRLSLLRISSFPAKVAMVELLQNPEEQEKPLQSVVTSWCEYQEGAVTQHTNSLLANSSGETNHINGYTRDRLVRCKQNERFIFG